MSQSVKIGVMVTIPTYNESANILPLIAKIHQTDPSFHIVVIDDNSPDGTWKLVEELSRRDRQVHLIHRIGRRGRGTAGIEGFLYALEKKADYIVEMDSDFSHNPVFLPSFLEKIATSDIVIGSRAVAGGGEVGRGALRRLITGLANVYIRLILRIPVRDCTSGFRMFRRKVLEEINVATLTSRGPSIVQELLYRGWKKGFSIVETPILFEERAAGASTFNMKIIFNSLYMIPRFRFQYRNYPGVPSLK
ncbi:MAG TPA: polyprenol monophosphomannose synthase [Nitrospiria bacterium]|nr:polyprenol monophosphomannose synthase [Nitrospiria bacterium]